MVQEEPASVIGLQDGLMVSGDVHGAGKAGAILVKNMLNVRTKKMDINLEMELGASIKAGIQYALQTNLLNAPLDVGVLEEFAIATSIQ